MDKTRFDELYKLVESNVKDEDEFLDFITRYIEFVGVSNVRQQFKDSMINNLIDLKNELLESIDDTINFIKEG